MLAEHTANRSDPEPSPMPGNELANHKRRGSLSRAKRRGLQNLHRLAQ